MTEVPQGRRTGRKRAWLAVTVLVVILALLIVPPYVSVSRYRSRITQLVSASLGRPVRLSSIELRMLPRPSFVLTDFVVEEDPAYGAEPLLHATTVTAAIRLFPLWRGSLQISRISVDEASLNLVRTNAGRWNLDSFFHTAATRPGAQGKRTAPFPYLEATNSRINIKDGVEKLPFSLVSADLSFSEESPGEWRIRLRGQPARTDVSLDLPDTGIVRMEATLHRAQVLREMPLHIDLDWREAQLGQLSRLLIGSDEGWRGDMTGEMHIDGTLAAARVSARLRASGVHRAEFTPASAMDFDATCGFLYRYSDRSMENLLCDSPVGNGRARLTGDIPGEDKQPRLSVELDRIPVQLALDTLRTLRRGLNPELQADGAVSGKITYDPVAANSNDGATSPTTRSRRPAPRAHPPVAGPLSGSLSIPALRLTGGGLTKPLFLGKLVLEPDVAGLVASVAISAGGPAPLAVSAHLDLNGYQASAHGTASLSQLQELARLAGLPNVSAYEGLGGPAASVDMNADGPWLSSAVLLAPETSIGGLPGPAVDPVLPPTPSDHVSGAITLHESAWKADFLANPVEIVSATLHLSGDEIQWDPVAFAFGPVKGAATLDVPLSCEVPGPCPPRFTVSFNNLDAEALQAAFLGAHRSDTLLSTLIARLTPQSAPRWPRLEGTVRANSVTLGPVNLTDSTTHLHFVEGKTEIDGFEATLLNGEISGTGAVTLGNKLGYHLEGEFKDIDPGALGHLLGMTWSGGEIAGTGQVDVSGYSCADLGSSAKGAIHFDWPHGAVSGDTPTLPAALSRFDRWSGDAEIANGVITLRQNEVQRGSRKVSVEAAAAFGDPPRVTFGPPPDFRAAKR